MQNTELNKKLEELSAKCKKANLRVTKQRIEIYKAIFESKAHPDAETLYKLIKKKVPNVALDTVYRTLTSLENLNNGYFFGLYNADELFIKESALMILL